MIPERTCSKCGESYPLTLEYFSRHSRGFQWWCKECVKKNNAKRRAEFHEDKILYGRAYYRGERRKRYDYNDRGSMVSDYVMIERPRGHKQREVYDFMASYKGMYGRFPSQHEIADILKIKYCSARAALESLSHMGFMVKREVYDRIKNHSEEEKTKCKKK